MRDLFFFVCFIVIFLFAFSTASLALITTNDQVNWQYSMNDSLPNISVSQNGSGLWTWQIIRNVINHGVWKIFGQVEPISNHDANTVNLR